MQGTRGSDVFDGSYVYTLSQPSSSAEVKPLPGVMRDRNAATPLGNVSNCNPCMLRTFNAGAFIVSMPLVAFVCMDADPIHQWSTMRKTRSVKSTFDNASGHPCWGVSPGNCAGVSEAESAIPKQSVSPSTVRRGWQYLFSFNRIALWRPPHLTHGDVEEGSRHVAPPPHSSSLRHFLGNPGSDMSCGIECARHEYT